MKSAQIGIRNNQAKEIEMTSIDIKFSASNAFEIDHVFIYVCASFQTRLDIMHPVGF